MEAAHGQAEVIIAKQRHGPTGTVQLHFNGPLTKFGDLERSGYELQIKPLYRHGRVTPVRAKRGRSAALSPGHPSCGQHRCLTFERTARAGPWMAATTGRR